jgi:hypothetical protein
MALTTYRSFVDALEALDITGVNRQFTQGPPLNPPGVGDCPFQYVRYPGADEIPLVFGEQGGWATFRAELVIGVEPVGQKTAPQNFDDTVDMMDAVTTAIRAADCITLSKLRWGVRQIIDTVAGQPYWAVLVTVEGSG